MMCVGCEHRSGPFTALTCSEKGRKVDEAAADPKESCRFWPDERGIVSHHGLEWYGPPFYIRLKVAAIRALLAWRMTLGERYAMGCGCLVGPKRFWNWINAR